MAATGHVEHQSAEILKSTGRTPMSINKTYTTADWDELAGSGQVDDWLLWKLIEMARYDKQGASVTINREDQTVTVRQMPHQGEEQVVTYYEPINEIVEIWLDSEERRTGRADIYDYTAEEVELIRDDIRISRSE